MTSIPFADRFSALPLILAGPILRRVEQGAVTVWLALKEPCMVTLRIYERDAEGELTQRFEGRRHTIRVGDHLHIVAVTARAASDEMPLAWGDLYYYDLFFEAADQVGNRSLHTPGVLNVDVSAADALRRLVYADYPLPSFVLPPAEVSMLRLVHGSCRKSHGTGKEMLSALDTILETSITQGGQRPQQLFLTGDQIYADDVAEPLLFVLMDAGNFLLEGNEEEVLPLVNAPARSLAPGKRGEVVRNKALFTTTTPQNHLLALGEYAAMYLFAWSDVVWPTEFPAAEELWQAYPEARPAPDDQVKAEAEYSAQLERVGEFRAGLPQVRRALANIPTYTICDDHEITDDWFLDGAWCQHVLASPLGRRVIRNGLLAYALFQAWGNTPEQFAGENGGALLDALDAWRGDESDAEAQTLAELLGLPQAFGGRGELPRSTRALHWHHAYYGPRYQVLLMDTRTRRIYRGPHEFPGLLSPAAMHAQITTAAHREAEVTIIVSATPVLGVDFIESVQLWSHWSTRENYTYDCEAWALEWSTFQPFLKLVSAMKRVVFLSGDVHYSFGSSLDYWDQQAGTTARLVDFTSSPLCNEGAGSHIAMLAIGYPRLLHLLRGEGNPTIDFFAWDITAANHHMLGLVLGLIWRRIYLFWWAIPRLLAARRSRDEIVLPAHGWLKGAFHGNTPDRVYRIHYLRNTLARLKLRKRDSLRLRIATGFIRLVRLALGGVAFIETGSRRTHRELLLRQRTIKRPPAIAGRAAHGTHKLERGLAKRRSKLVEAVFHSVAWLNWWKAGELVVAYNSLGELRFEWTAEKREVIQRLWWHSDDPQHPLLKTDYHDTLNLPRWDAAPPLP
jgi:hypothetical protein